LNGKTPKNDQRTTKERLTPKNFKKRKNLTCSNHLPQTPPIPTTMQLKFTATAVVLASLASVSQYAEAQTTEFRKYWFASWS
jgi:hypothetical protein